MVDRIIWEHKLIDVCAQCVWVSLWFDSDCGRQQQRTTCKKFCCINVTGSSWQHCYYHRSDAALNLEGKPDHTTITVSLTYHDMLYPRPVLLIVCTAIGHATTHHFVSVTARRLGRWTLNMITHHSQQHTQRQTTSGHSTKSTCRISLPVMLPLLLETKWRL